MKIKINKTQNNQTYLQPRHEFGDPTAKPLLATTKMTGTVIICRWEVHMNMKNEK